MVQSKLGIAETLNKFILSVFTNEDFDTLSEVAADPNIKNLFGIKFMADDVNLVLKNLRSSSSPGPDRIHPRVLKECAEKLSEPLCFAVYKVPSGNEAALCPEKCKYYTDLQ